jgi:hypothetical protein
MATPCRPTEYTPRPRSSSTSTSCSAAMLNSAVTLYRFVLRLVIRLEDMLPGDVPRSLLYDMIAKERRDLRVRAESQRRGRQAAGGVDAVGPSERGSDLGAKPALIGGARARRCAASGRERCQRARQRRSGRRDRGRGRAREEEEGRWALPPLQCFFDKLAVDILHYTTCAPPPIAYVMVRLGETTGPQPTGHGRDCPDHIATLVFFFFVLVGFAMIASTSTASQSSEPGGGILMGFVRGGAGNEGIARGGLGSGASART